MLQLAVTGYQLSLFLHITAAVVGLGASFAESITFQVALKLDPRHLPYVHRLQATINSRFVGPALAVVLVTGFYQVSEGSLDLGSFWLAAALAIVVVIGALSGAYFIPTDRRLERMVSDEIAAAGSGEVRLSERYQQMARTEGLVGALTGLLIIVVIFLMVVKPGA